MEESWELWEYVLEWKPRAAEGSTMTKSLPADCGCLVPFPQWRAVVCQTRRSVHCDPSMALHALLTLDQPVGSDPCPGKVISALRPGWGHCAFLVHWHKLLRGSCVLVSESLLCAEVTKRAFYLAVMAERPASPRLTCCPSHLFFRLRTSVFALYVPSFTAQHQIYSLLHSVALNWKFLS